MWVGVCVREFVFVFVCIVCVRELFVKLSHLFTKFALSSAHRHCRVYGLGFRVSG